MQALPGERVDGPSALLGVPGLGGHQAGAGPAQDGDMVKFFQEMLKKLDSMKDKKTGSNRPAQHDSGTVS